MTTKRKRRQESNQYRERGISSQGTGIRASKQNARRKKKMIRKLITLAAAGVVVVLAGCHLFMRGYVNKVDDKRICDNIFIGEVEVSGMTSKKAKSILKEHYDEDAQVTITMKAEDKTAKATLEELGVAAKDVDGMIKKAQDYGKKGSVWKRYRQLKALKKEAYVIQEEYQVDDEAAEEVLKTSITSLEDGAVNATITKTDAGFVVTEGKDGTIVNVEKSLEKVVEHLNNDWDHKGFAVEMVLETGEPEIQASDLEKIEDILGEYSTDAGGGERWKNLQAGSNLLNGVVLMPGEEISVYNTTAPYDAEHGYVQAGAYENGEVVQDWGGGICQVSTTLYNAVLYAELEVVERYPHSMSVSYVDPSRDAAIAGGVMDFRFKNSYDAPIYIFSEIDWSNQLRFVIYGKETRPENRTVEYESETIAVDEYKTTYKENPSLTFGKLEYTGSPHSGMDARLWKIVYEDGKEVSKEVYNKSYYMRADQVIEVGTAGAEGSALSTLQSAIASQDYDAIISAINSTGESKTETESEAR